jgi:ABC-type phosphate/phosphonate transport system substrate-binding protein
MTRYAQIALLLFTGGLTALMVATAPAEPAPKTIKIGTTGSLAAGTSGGDEKGALNTLHDFIKSETGYENEIVDHHGWRELAERMEKGEDQIGVFPGYELAWAREKYPKLQPLAVAETGRPYQQIFIVTAKDSKATGIGDLKGKKIGMPREGQGYPLLVLQTLAKEAPKSYFGEVKFYDNAEEAIDDAVDGVVDAVAVDLTQVDAFKRRKPARFARLKDLAKAKPVPNTTIVYYEGKLDGTTLANFRDGLVNANKKERGRSLLSYFKLTGFVLPPHNFDGMLTQTRAEYPEAK